MIISVPVVKPVPSDATKATAPELIRTRTRLIIGVLRTFVGRLGACGEYGEPPSDW